MNDIKKYFEENKDNQEVQTFVQGLNPVTLDRVKAFVANDKDAKSWLDSEKDKHLNKGIDTFKTNNLEKLIDEEVKKRFPDKDPKDVELEKIKAELAKIQTEKQREISANKAIKLANEKKLPLDIVDFFISDDEEKTVTNLSKLEEVFSKHIQAAVEQRFNGEIHVPPGGDENKTDYSKMSMEEYAQQWNKNK